MSSPSGDDEIDLRKVAGALGATPFNRPMAGASLLLSGIYAFRSKPVWEGQFRCARRAGAGGGQLALAAANPLLANLAVLQAVDRALCRQKSNSREPIGPETCLRLRAPPEAQGRHQC